MTVQREFTDLLAFIGRDIEKTRIEAVVSW
jgi:hypothetical protein